MKKWEEDNPGQNPYPPIFAELVLQKLRDADPSDLASTIKELVSLAEEELQLG